MDKFFVKLANDESTYKKVVEYMKKTDADYDIPMSMRVNIGDYVKKIVSKAVTIAAMENDEIIGMANFYCNDMETKTCYITNVSISKKAQEKGYHLNDFVHAVLIIAQKVGMKRLRAETTDRRVLILHKRLGAVEFKREEINGVIHYHNYLEDIDGWLKKDSARRITILDL